MHFASPPPISHSGTSPRPNPKPPTGISPHPNPQLVLCEPVYEHQQGDVFQATSIRLCNIPWVFKIIAETFAQKVAQCGGQVPTHDDRPPWEGAATWGHIRNTVAKEREWDKSFKPTPENCFRVLQELAEQFRHDLWARKSHDVRLVLLIRHPCVCACEIPEVHSLFAGREHEVALSYQWAAPLAEIYEGLTAKCNTDELIWKDILFNKQGGGDPRLSNAAEAQLDSGKVMEITKKVYVECKRHILVIHKVQQSDGSEVAAVVCPIRHKSDVRSDESKVLAVVKVLGRAWIGIEVGTRAADRDASMVELSDPYQSAEKFYLISLRREETKPFDFFHNLHAHIKDDIGMIQAALAQNFHTEYHHGPDAFNKIIDDWIRLTGGIQRMERLYALPDRQGHQEISVESWKLSQELSDKAKFRECLHVRELQLKVLIDMHGHEHIDVAKSLNNIGEVYRKLGKNKEALEKYEESVRIKVKNLGHDHMDVAASLDNMGIVYQRLGKNKEALEKHEEALRIRVKNVGHDHIDVAKSLNNIGAVYQNLGKNKEALEKYEESVRIKVKNLGHDHIDVAKSLNNIGLVYRRLGKNKEALEKYEESVRIKVKNLGHDHIDVAASLNNIGVVYKNLGKNKEALEKYEESLRIQVKNLGHDHMDVAASLLNIGNVYLNLGKNKEALEKYEESLRIRVKNVGHDHMDVANSEYNIARLKRSEGKKSEAAALFRHCAEVYGRVYGPDHSETVDALEQVQRCAA